MMTYKTQCGVIYEDGDDLQILSTAETVLASSIGLSER